MHLKRLLNFLIATTLFGGCAKKPNTLFTSLSPSYTGITFENRLSDTDSINILDYLYYYNGGGVAIGDINNDGLPDIYFTSNEGSDKLYLNKGNMKFEDITIKAGVQGKGNWKTGVTMADVNGDGLLDIYVSEVGGYKNLHGRNELFINNGASSDGTITFTEEAHKYELDIEGFNTQATFFDYDHDGDLDMFLVNHSVHSTATYRSAAERNVKSEMSGDKLFRNDQTQQGRHFTEVTEQAGIYSSAIGYGLNVITADLNNDGWDDIYVSNDFHENDYYYVNQKNGTFKEVNQKAFGHESRFSMGCDINDLNNDGWPDIITLDMLPPDKKILNTSASDDPLDIYQFKLGFGYHHQYSRNCLQLNVDGGNKFSDIALYAGVATTDWSWSPLIADFDNDGIKDLFISNGIVRRPNDLDYIKFISGTTIRDNLNTGRTLDKASIEKMPDGKMSNCMFKGSPDMRFKDETKNWGFNKPTYSNGAAYADLDNDGDLDIVVNNINEPASIYQNNLNKDTVRHNFLSISLKGDSSNAFGYGTKVIIKQKDKLQLNYCTASRGFESASVQSIHFGLGADSIIDTVEIIWPDGFSQMLNNVPANHTITVLQRNATLNNFTLLPGKDSSISNHLFTNITDSIAFPYRHIENKFTDFNTQPFIPHELSTQGPKMAVADVNGDGLDDVFICGASGQPGKLLIQNSTGDFISTNENIFEKDSLSEDVNAVFFDANNDGFPDLYVVSGGNEYEDKNEILLDRLYINNGKGKFYKSNTLPPIYENKSVAVPCDFDKDGDLDLFIGARVVAGKYGVVPHSYLLLNDGKGNFKIANDSLAPDLQNIGMVTDAAWTDIDNDGWKDLVVSGEWMPITIFKNNKGQLKNISSQAIKTNTTGWWNCLKAVDIDNDGDEDLIAGNWGENSKLHASEQYPLKMYLGDFAKNGSLAQLLSIENNNSYYTFLGKEDLEKQLPSLMRKRYPDYISYASQTIEQLLGDGIKNVQQLNAVTLSSMIFINDGKGNYTAQKLPAEAQWYPIFSFITGDFNNDRKTDIICAGNFYGVIPYEGRYDAGFGTVLAGNENNTFKAISPVRSGLVVDGEIRDIKTIHRPGNKVTLAFAGNNQKVIFYANGSGNLNIQTSR